jgi:hypothetical protein
MDIKSAIKQNLQYQKKYRKKTYTKPLLFHLIEKFISERKLICYGGMAINAYLPNEKQFYDKTDIPDYDCFSDNSIRDAVVLANLLSKHHMEKVEVKAAMFPGTMKIYVNFIPIVDITQIHHDIFFNIQKKAIKMNTILYAPPNYLKISLYQELSRPLGDIMRWEKINERLELLNHSHPLYVQNCSITGKDIHETDEHIKLNQQIISLIKEKKWVVLGDFGLSFYLKHFPKVYHNTKRLIDIPFILIDSLKDVVLPFEYTTRTYEYHFLNTFHQIIYKDQPVLYVFITNSCQSYNEVKGFHIASIDTILSIYYALSYLNIPSLNVHKINSYIYLLNNIKSNEGVCKRFHMPCVGVQPSIEDIRKMRDKKFKLYKKNKSKKLYNMYFFQYKPRTRKLNVK